MVDCKDIKICSQELLKIIKSEKNVKEEQKIIKLLSEYIERLIFNITALASLLCLKIENHLSGAFLLIPFSF